MDAAAGTGRADIRIHLAHGLAPSRRARLLIGTRLMQGRDLDGVPQSFCSGAIVPSGPWREPEAAEVEMASSDGAPSDWSTCIAVAAIEPSLLAEFHASGIAAATDLEALKEMQGRPQFRLAHEKLLDHIARNFARSLDRLKILGYSTELPDRLSTSFDRARGCYVGMHVDGWDRLRMTERHLARNRIAVNLGLGDRWLLFAGQSFMRIRDEVDPTISNPRAVVTSFFSRFPNTPVLRLRVAPGEAYIAPTDNLIHDGMTAGSKHFDVYFTALGDFRC